MPATIHQKNYYYLALGDSYTIGEMVAFQDNFPNRLVALMKSAGNNFQPPRIIAQTGWTTDELEAGIVAAGQEQPLRSSYDFVTLLIGVNNQYRGRTAENYQPEFEELLKKAIGFAGGKADHVAVLSIPDWGVTPFATDRDRAQIAGEIDAYNKVNRQVAQLYKVHYINITPWTREAATDLSLLAADGLHPSAKEYQRWAESLQQFFKTKL